MRARYAFRRRTLWVLCLLGLPLGCAHAEGDPRTINAAEGPLVLELFTSQGCSSCPPADQLLSKLASAGSLADRAVAPLSFHVDYTWTCSVDKLRTAEDNKRRGELQDRRFTPEEPSPESP